MRIVVCYNQVAEQPLSGIAEDLLSEAGAAEEADAVADALRLLGHEPTLVPLHQDLSSFIAALLGLQPDLVFNLCEGFRGDSRYEMHVAAVFEMLGLAYTGSSPLVLGLTRDKGLTKDLLRRHGLPTPDYHLVAPGASLPNLVFDRPFIVKPCSEDASLSISHASVVNDSASLQRQVAYIHHHYRQAALVEEFIDGREFNVALLGDRSVRLLPIAEICFSEQLDCRLVSYAGKWHEESIDYSGSMPICPALITDIEQQKLSDIALKAWQLLGARDYARIDIRWRDNIPYILELNANPDISPEAGLARAARCGGLEYPELVESIVENALLRKEAIHA